VVAQSGKVYIISYLLHVLLTVYITYMHSMCRLLLYTCRPVKVTLIDHRRTSHLASSSRDVPFKESPSVATGDALAQTVKEKLCIEACSDTSHVEQDQRVDGGGLNEEDGKVQTTLACSSASTTLACTRTPENSLEDGVGCKLQPAQHTVRDTAMSADLKAATHSGTSVTKSTVQRYAQSSQSDSPLLRAYRVLSEWCEPETCQLLGEGWSERDVSQLRYVEASFVERQQQMDRTVNRADDSSQLGVCGAVKETQYLHVRCLYHELLHLCFNHVMSL